MRPLTILVSLALGFAPVAKVHADPTSFPSQPINLVVPLAPGGATDVLARLASAPAEKVLGRPIVIENRPGAGGTIAATAVATAKPDGHTLLFANFATQTVSPLLLKNVSYHPENDFKPIVLIASQPHLLLVNKNLPVRNIAELISYSKENPDKISYASSGVGSPLHLAAEFFKMRTGSKMTHVPYKASPQALTDLVSGQVQVMFDNLTTALPLVQSGELRAIAITSVSRSPLAPEIPTIVEQGVSEFETYGWWGVMAPVNTPSAVLDKLSSAYLQGLASPDLRSKLEEQGYTVIAGQQAVFQQFLSADIKKWAPVIKAAAEAAAQR